MVILGVSSGHDANICVVRDGKIILHVEKERLTMVRYDTGSMEEHIPSLLATVGLSIEDIDVVASSIPVWSHVPRTGRVRGAEYNHEAGVGHGTIDLCGKRYPIVQIGHHLGHVAYSYFLSPFREANILTLDGGGNFSHGLFCRGVGNRIEVVDNLGEQTLGVLWCALSMRLFGNLFAAGKVMGLSAYGESSIIDALDREWGYTTTRGNRSVRLPFPDWGTIPDIPGIPKSLLAEYTSTEAANAAASVQTLSTKVVMGLIDAYAGSESSDSLCLGGGVALNCVTNEVVRRSGRYRDVFVGPAVNDAGLSIGFALYLWHCVMGNERIEPGNNHLSQQPPTPYLGPVHTKQELRKAVSATEVNGYYTRLIPDWREANRVVAELIASGKIIGLWRGRSESGPRALGNRSIVADPRDRATRDRINASIKFREGFRPLAPAVIAELATDFFDFSGNSPYMSFAPDANRAGVEAFAATVHVDGKARLQSVADDWARKFRHLLEEFKDITDVPGLVNTSLNTKGQPLAESPLDAVETLRQSDIDGVLIEDTLVLKKHVAKRK